jgi:hypothetical protein
MAKKQTRRSISVSRTTYERLKAFCETNNISMSQLVETRVNDFLGADAALLAPTAPPMSMASAPLRPIAARPMASAPVSKPIEPRATQLSAAPSLQASAQAPSLSGAATGAHPAASPAGQVVPPPAAAHAPSAIPSERPAAPAAPMTSAAARFAVEPPLPIIKPRQDTAAPKPAEKRPEQIFTF